MFAISFLSLAALATAQQRHNFLAIDGELADDAGPYYFIAYGDSGNAYAKAAPFAAALGLNLAYDPGRKVLVFNDGRTRVEWDATSDVAAGLDHEMGVLRVGGTAFGRAVPHAIVVNGTSYVAITPLVEAFGGRHGWHQDARVISVDSAPPPPAAGAGGALAAPRVGLHDGFTRVAVDVPAGQEAELLVGDGSVALVFPGASIQAVDRTVEDGPLTRYYASEVDGGAALVMMVQHPIDANGGGYRLGRAGEGVVYVDLGPGIAGSPAAGDAPETRGLPTAGGPPTAAAAAPPATRRQVVVIDAGHGGHDPGTVSSWAQEKAIVLSVANRLATLLESEGIEVILTRDHDVFLTLQQRATFATTDRNIFISIHANAAANASANGIETWVFGRPLDPTLIDRAIRENGGGDEGAQLTQEAAASLDIASDILSETQLNYSLSLANRIQDRLIANTGARDRGVRQNLFYVIKNARIPAVLVELGFVSHSEEGRRLTQDPYQQVLADALADGVLDFLHGGGELALR